MPKPFAVANWKMNKTASEAAEFMAAFLPLVKTAPGGISIVVCPPFTALAAVAATLPGHRVELGAQNMHWEPKGAFTGEISAPMLIEHGVRYVILGHSERRQYYNETDRAVNLKVKTALRSGLVPIVAVGETLEQRELGLTDDTVIRQTREALDGVDRGALDRAILAYEPVWAIGTGKSCDPGEADRVMSIIRNCVSGLDETPILYGGSMKPENVAQYAERPNIDGGLVGGASLDPKLFAELITNARV
jgi:triosephosphate isomerase (TIM)